MIQEKNQRKTLFFIYLSCAQLCRRLKRQSSNLAILRRAGRTVFVGQSAPSRPVLVSRATKAFRPIVGRNASRAPNVPRTKLASTKNVRIPAQEHVVEMHNAELSITARSVSARPDGLATL